MKKVNLFLLLLLPLCCMAQSLQLKGKVTDAAAPLAWANVVITSPEGKIITGMTTLEDGSFEMKLNKGTYNLKISFLGYNDWQKEITMDTPVDLGTIVVSESANTLQQVVIKTNKKMMEQKIDRLVYTVDNNAAAAGGDAINAMSTAPGLVVQNNAISMLGKGASRVMIDGRIVALSGEELISFLKSISASDIKNIEIITNPPAKYEAAGDGGLINIILKKGASDSWKNSTTLTYDQNTYGSTTLRNNFLYNKDKLKFTVSGTGKSGNTQSRQDLDTYYPGGLWELKYKGKQKTDHASGRITADYALSDRTSIGAQYLGNFNSPDSKDKAVINIFNTGKTLDSLLINNGRNNQHSNSQTYNAHIISKLDTLGRNIAIDVDYFTFDAKIDNRFTAETFSPDTAFLNVNQAARNISNQNINNFTIKADMEHPLAFASLSYGAKVSFSNSKGAIQYYNTISGSPELDPNRSNTFEYRERNQAVYINGTKKINDKFNVQLGLRLENTQTEGYSQTLNQNNTNNYFKLFPTVYLSYTENDNHSFLFNYGKRINRPGFRDLNPFRAYLNSNSYSEGNPFLQPSYNDNFDLTYTYKGKLRTNAFFNVITNGYGVVFSSNAATNTQIISRENYFKEYYYGIGENYTATIAPWWQSQNLIYLLGSKTVFATNIQAVPMNKMQVYLATNNTFSLNKQTKLQLDYLYCSPYKRGLYEYGTVSGLNLAVKRSFLNDNMQVAILFNDIFNTTYLKDYTSVVNGIKQVYNENNSSRFVRVSLTYNFGNNKVKVDQRNFGNEEEKKRTEN